MIHINNFRKEQNSNDRNIYAVNAKVYIGISQLWEGLISKLLTPGQLLGYPWGRLGTTVQMSFGLLRFAYFLYIKVKMLENKDIRFCCEKEKNNFYA